ncbi:MAG: hypothetical protein F4X11_16325 [Acidobacteria bacterium]|nr:hypothetical protein [Acidobacteriota bacterium]
MAPSRWIAAIAAVLLMALAPFGVALHEHGADPQTDGHTDCDACLFRHLSVITADGAPAPTAPNLVAHAVVSTPAAGNLHVAFGIRPTRAPPV